MTQSGARRSSFTKEKIDYEDPMTQRMLENERINLAGKWIVSPGCNRVRRHSVGALTFDSSLIDNFHQVPEEWKALERSVLDSQTMANSKSQVKVSSIDDLLTNHLKERERKVSNSDDLLSDPQGYAREESKSLFRGTRSHSVPAIDVAGSSSKSPGTATSFSSQRNGFQMPLSPMKSDSPTHAMAPLLQRHGSSILTSSMGFTQQRRKSWGLASFASPPTTSTASAPTNASPSFHTSPTNVKQGSSILTSSMGFTQQRRKSWGPASSASSPMTSTASPPTNEKRRRSWQGCLDSPASSVGNASPVTPGTVHTNMLDTASTATGRTRSKQGAFPHAAEIFDLLDDDGDGVIDQSRWAIFDDMARRLSPELAYTMPSHKLGQVTATSSLDKGYPKQVINIDGQEWMRYIRDLVKHIGPKEYETAAKKVKKELSGRKFLENF